jgi:hypothetical protein
MVPQHRGTRVLALVATLVVACSWMDWSAAHAATGDPVLLNEMLLSHGGADTGEFVELYGTTPGTSLAGLALIVVEGDSAQSPGTVTYRLDFAAYAHLGGNRFYLVGNPTSLGAKYSVTPDVAIGDETFQNGSETVALVVAASAPAVGSPLTGTEVVRDAVAVWDSGPLDRFFLGVPVLGPNAAGFLPPGLRRVTDGADTDTAADWLITSDSFDASHTPTAASAYNFPPTATCGSPVTTVAGTQVTSPVSATDPDGVMTSFSVVAAPPTGAVSVANEVPAAAPGGTATANFVVGAGVPAGDYDVTVTAANSEKPPQQASCHLAVTVTEPEPRPTPTPTPTPEPTPVVSSVTMNALHALLDGYLASGDVAAGKAHLFTDRLARVDRFWAAGQDAAAHAQLRAFANQVMGLSPRWVTPAAADALAAMANDLAASS